MGEVYAAEDTRLHRRVAIKILPSHMATDEERLQRFRREAHAVAALNHPNVVTIHSVEEAEGIHFLTMELIEGQTLDRLIPPHGLQWGHYFRWALPLVDAVSAAHEHGIIHRDLKPANVMVSAKGVLKVLDFGLAKLRPETAGSTATTLSTGRVTEAHTVLGTAAYMSPEQAEGRQLDARSDIFSIGVLLFEMAVGQRPFSGDTTMALLSAILKDTPPAVSSRRTDAPSDLDRILRRCLAKEPSRRYQTAIDLRNDLEDLQQQIVSDAVAPVTARAPSRGRRAMRLAVTLAGFVLVAYFASLFAPLRDRAPAETALSPTFTQLTHLPGIEWFPSLSADGRWIVFAGDAAGNRDIYLHSVTGSTPINLTKDSLEDDDQPAFSPDGELVAFRSNRDGGGIFVMGRTGEAVRRITRAGFNPAWSPDGKQIVYTLLRLELRPQNSDGLSELWTIDVNGGEPRQIFSGDATLSAWSPDGRRIAFGQRLGESRVMDIVTIAADGASPPVHVVRDSAIDWNPVWAPDGRHLYFVSDRAGSPNIWRIPIDQSTGAALGQATPLTSPAAFAAHLTISGDGRTLAYSSVLEAQNLHRLRLDPDRGEAMGEIEPVTTGTRFWSSPDPAPDGSRVVMYSQVRPEGDLYIINADGSGIRQLTSDEAVDRVPRWSPDGQWIAMFSNRSGRLDLWKVRIDGSDLRQLTHHRDVGVVAWSPDGRRLAATGAQLDPRESHRGFIIDANRAASEQALEEFPPAPPPHPDFVPNSWSPDGTRLVGQNGYSTLGISVYTLATKRFERIVEFGEWPVWLPDGRRVLIVSRGREFHIVDTVAKSSKRILSVLRDTLGPPRLTKDGRAAYFSRRVTESDVWLVEMAQN
jgi:Tol biopolymer transport system component